MYEKHFSFKCKPFELIPNPDFLFPSNPHKKAMTYLDYGIKEKIGFILITGEIGSGKTTITRNLIKNLNGSIKLSRINNTKVSSEELISMINDDFGLATEGKSKLIMLNELNQFLIEQYSKKVQSILLIDEAQNLPPELLEEVRLLSNLETDKSKLLQIILIGQPELRRTLMTPELMQLRQRININYHITPLSMDDTLKYIKHRLSIAGNSEAIPGNEDMLQYIYRFSHGIPRLINILCDFALLTAYVEGMEKVSVDIIRQVVKDLETNNYWNDQDDNDYGVQEQKKNDLNLTMANEDIAFRLTKLENSFTKTIEEIANLEKKVNEITNAVTEKLKVTSNL